MNIEREEAVELFELRCRGALAAAFSHADLVPTADHWQMLRGNKEISLRDMGEISFATVTELSLSFYDKRPTENPST